MYRKKKYFLLKLMQFLKFSSKIANKDESITQNSPTIINKKKSKNQKPKTKNNAHELRWQKFILAI